MTRRSSSPNPLTEIERPAKRVKRSPDSSPSSTSSTTLALEPQSDKDQSPAFTLPDLHPHQALSASSSQNLAQLPLSTFSRGFPISLSHHPLDPILSNFQAQAPVPHSSIDPPLSEKHPSSPSDSPHNTPSHTPSNLSINEEGSSQEPTESWVEGEDQERDQEQDSDSTSRSTSESALEQTDPYMNSTVLRMREVLEKNWLFIDDDDAEHQAGSLMEKAKEIIHHKRGSDWGPAKCEDAKHHLKKWGGEPEATFIVKLMRYFHGDTRMLLEDEYLDDSALQKAHAWIEKAWEKDHLNERYNIDFLSDGLPTITSGDDYLDKLIASFPRLQNPRPDVAWGLWKDAFTERQAYILDNHKNNLAGPGMYDVFFIIEAKCMNAPIQEAENQCMRSGCAMVHTRRRLNEAAADAIPIPSVANFPKVDMNSFAFSLAIAADHGRLFVNWALEVGPGHVRWHMHRLASYDFRALDQLNELHRHMNNVLDWGVRKRKLQVMELCDKIAKTKALYAPPPPKMQKKNDRTSNKEGKDKTGKRKRDDGTDNGSSEVI